MAQQRAAERFSNHCRIGFSGIEISVKGEGTIADLSKSGCRVESDARLEKGVELKLELFLPDYSWPMKVDRAVVRWIKGRSFGVEFLSLQSAQRDRLVRFIMKMKQDIGH